MSTDTADQIAELTRLGDAMAGALRAGIDAWDSGVRSRREAAIDAMVAARRAWARRNDDPAKAHCEKPPDVCVGFVGDGPCDRCSPTPAALRFVSFEPLLEDLGRIDLAGIGWAICGGESGPGARPCDVRWIRSIVAQCMAAGVPCFVKQLGASPVDSMWRDGMGAPNDRRAIAAADAPGLHTPPDILLLRDRKGGDPEEWPDDLRVREMP